MSTATFDPLTAVVVVNSAQGTSTMRPPFDSREQIFKYVEYLTKVSGLKSAQVVTARFDYDELAEIVLKYTDADLPGVFVYNVTKPPIFAVVYTDINGNSSFSYKNDPQNRITLTKNGSEIRPLVIKPKPGDVAKPGNSKNEKSQGGALILLSVCSCLLCIACAIILYLALKKHT